MRDFLFKTLPAFLKSKWYIWGLFLVILAGMIAMFIHSWLGYAPNGGHPMPEPWQEEGSGFKAPKK